MLAKIALRLANIEIMNKKTTNFYYRELMTLSLLSILLVGCQGANLLTGFFGKKTETITPLPIKVSALGYIEPESKIRKVSISSSLAGDRIEQITVKENQKVTKGQTLAILNSYGTLKAAFDEANQNVKVAQSQLAQVKAGAKQGEIKAQEFKIQTLERQRKADQLTQNQIVARYKASQIEAKTESAKYDSLYKQGAVSELERNRYRTRYTTATADLMQAIENRNGKLMTLESQIEAEKNTLKQITEVRPVDVTKAQADLQKSIAARNRAKQEFAYATVSAPQNGEILKIIAHPGDKVGDQGLLEMADTSSMVVNSEVYQTDMPKIFIGQRVTITADGFNGSAPGHVYQINRLVKQQSVFSGKPGENLDMRVFEVKIKLAPSIEEKSKFKYASNMQVNVVFEPKEEKSNP